MTSVIHEFKVTAFGTTRDDCINLLDKTGLEILNLIGGAPWQVPDDDFKKIVAAQVTPVLGDEEGFCYAGVRTYQFRGPIMTLPNQIYHEGHKVQSSVDE